MERGGVRRALGPLAAEAETGPLTAPAGTRALRLVALPGRTFA